jgi:hypothetical protein
MAWCFNHYQTIMLFEDGRGYQAQPLQMMMIMMMTMPFVYGCISVYLFVCRAYTLLNELTDFYDFWVRLVMT